MKLLDLSHLGEPDLQLGDLRIWVHSRQFPESVEYWDANWLNVTALNESTNSHVYTTGAILHGGEFATFRAETEQLYSTLSGAAKLGGIEPWLSVTMKGNGRGAIELEVCITTDDLAEKHTYMKRLDQTHLPPVVRACQNILAKYPIFG
ncbi:MAG: hypothetical protein ACKVS6_11360 [Planctomycetota bacterium]